MLCFVWLSPHTHKELEQYLCAFCHPKQRIFLDVDNKEFKVSIYSHPLFASPSFDLMSTFGTSEEVEYVTADVLDSKYWSTSLFSCPHSILLWWLHPHPSFFFGQVCESFASSLWEPWSAANKKALNCGEYFSATQFGMVGSLTTTANDRIGAQRQDSDPSNPVQFFSWGRLVRRHLSRLLWS